MYMYLHTLYMYYSIDTIKGCDTSNDIILLLRLSTEIHNYFYFQSHRRPYLLMQVVLRLTSVLHVFFFIPSLL